MYPGARAYRLGNQTAEHEEETGDAGKVERREYNGIAGQEMQEGGAAGCVGGGRGLEKGEGEGGGGRKEH